MAWATQGEHILSDFLDFPSTGKNAKKMLLYFFLFFCPGTSLAPP